MIACLVVAALAGPVVLEYPDVNAQSITVEAVVKIGVLNGRQQALAQVIDDTMLNATDSYNSDDLWQYSTLAGEGLRCSLSGDHFRVVLSVPKNQLALAGELTSEVLMHSRFAEDAIDADIVAVGHRPESFWKELLLPFKLNYAKIHRDDVLAFYHKTFIPEATTIAISGPFAASEGQAAMNKYLQGWSAPKPPAYVRKYEDPPPPLLPHHAFPVTTVELYGPVFGSSDEDFARNLLTTTAIGVGKSCSMFQILRESMGLSYLQQAIVAPTPGGFQTHMVMVLKPTDDETKYVDLMRSALAADVPNWTEETRTRALGMATAFLRNDSIATPLYLDGASAIGSGREDQMFLNAYWTEKMGHAWDPNAVLQYMSSVSLEDLKRMAAQLISSAQGGVVHGG